MSEELERLARRAPRAGGFRFVAGMALVRNGERYRVVGLGEGGVSAFRVGFAPRRGDVPDLADAATLGCLVKTAVGLLDAIDAAGGATSTRRASLAAAVADYITGTSDGVTLAAAIVAALEAASEVAP